MHCARKGISTRLLIVSSLAMIPFLLLLSVGSTHFRFLSRDGTDSRHICLQGSRKLSFKEFERAVEEIAAEKKVGLETVQRQILASGGPKRTGTTPTSRVRLHDDKATYTGQAPLDPRTEILWSYLQQFDQLLTCVPGIDKYFYVLAHSC